PDGQVTHGRTLIQRWDGQQWQIVPSPNPEGMSGALLESVAFAGKNDGWAVGRYIVNGIYHNLMLHWDGNDWERVPGYDEPGAVWSQLNSVSATRQDTWAVGAYSMVPNPGAGQWAITPAFPGEKTLIIHLGEQGWERVESPNAGVG